MTVTAQANRLGVSHSTISRMRTGERRPSAKLVNRIALVYRLDSHEVIDLLRLVDEGTDQELGDFLSRVFDRG